MNIQEQKQRFTELLKNDDDIISLGEKLVNHYINGNPEDVYHEMKSFLESRQIQGAMYMPTDNGDKSRLYYDILKINSISRFLDHKN